MWKERETGGFGGLKANPPKNGAMIGGGTVAIPEARSAFAFHEESGRLGEANAFGDAISLAKSRNGKDLWKDTNHLR